MDTNAGKGLKTGIGLILSALVLSSVCRQCRNPFTSYLRKQSANTSTSAAGSRAHL